LRLAVSKAPSSRLLRAVSLWHSDMAVILVERVLPELPYVCMTNLRSGKIYPLIKFKMLYFIQIYVL
jgi:hypothetical protein